MTPPIKPRVVIESPFAGDTKVNTAYARACMKHSLELGEAPFASHLLYTQCLDDEIEDERRLGIEAGLQLSRDFEMTAIYTDLGMSSGMLAGAARAHALNRQVVYRRLEGEWAEIGKRNQWGRKKGWWTRLWRRLTKR